MIQRQKNQKGSVFTMMMATVAMVGIVGVAGMNIVTGPITTASKVTHHNMAKNDLLMNAKVVVMNASTRDNMGDEDNDGYVEPVPFIPTTETSCTISLSAGGQGGCLPADIGAILTDPWGTQYAYCVWDHGDPNSSDNRIDGEDSTSGAVLAIISAGPNKRLETPCLPYDGDPDTSDVAINPDGIGDDLVQIYTYAAAVAGSGGLWELKQNEPTTAIIDKKLEIGDVSSGTGFAFDTATGQGEFPYVKTDFLASKSGGTTPVTMDSNIALDGNWLSGDGENEGIYVNANGHVGIGMNNPRASMDIRGDAFTNISISSMNISNSVGLDLYTQRQNADEQMGSANPSGDNKAWRVGVYASGNATMSDHYAVSWWDGLNWQIPFVITPEGKVGIGTGNPERKLDIMANGLNDGVRVLSSGEDNVSLILGAQGTGNANLYLDASDGDAVGVDYLRIYHESESLDAVLSLGSNAGDMRFITGGSDRLVIRQNGNVGVGTSSPAVALDVRGEVGGNMDGSIARFARNSHASQYLSIEQGASGHVIRGYSDVVNAKNIVLDATTDDVNTLPTGGESGILLRVRGENKLHVREQINVYNNRITALASPTVSTDAANKAYVDSLGNRTCANAQILKYQSGTWQCAADNSGGGADNLGGGGTTTGTLYSKAANGYGYVGQDGNNYFRFDAGAGSNRILTRIGAEWVLLNDTTTFRPYANNTLDLGISGARWKNGWFAGDVTSGSLTVNGPIYNDHSSTAYDVWIQGGAASSGEARNLAILGVISGDYLSINHSSEYTGGTRIGGPVTLNGNTHVTGAITAPAGTLRDSGGGWVRTYGNTGWYNGTYGGGWYMIDTTWVRSYSNKSVYTAGNMQAGAFLYASDARLKANIRPLELSLEALEEIQAYRYHYKADTDQTPHIGVLAQEVKAVFPEAVKTGQDGMMSVDYPALVPVLIEAVKQLKADNEAIRRQLKADNDNLRMEMRALAKGAR